MKYTVYGTIQCGVYTEVEADSPEEAQEIAEQRDVTGLCYKAETSNATVSWNLCDGLGDMVEDIEVDE